MECRLLYLIGQLGTGGAERQLCYLLQAMDRNYYHPAVAVWNSSWLQPYASRIESLGVPIYVVPHARNPTEKLIGFRGLVRRLQPEVVHSYSFYTNFAAWWGTLGSTTLPVGSIRSNFLLERRTVGKLLRRLSGRWPSAQICNSFIAQRNVEKYVGSFKPSRTYVVPNRLDLEHFKPSRSFPSEKLLLAVGSLSRTKRWDRMLNIAARLASKNRSFIIRHAGSGPLLAELRAQTKRLGIEENIEFLGSRDDIAKLLGESMFLIHTSDDEGCPNVVMEAMACGRAVISTDVGDIPRIIEDGKTGFFVRHGDDAAFVERVVQLLRDPILCREMGEAGRSKAEHEFSLGRLVEETLAVYREIGWNEKHMATSKKLIEASSA